MSAVDRKKAQAIRSGFSVKRFHTVPLLVPETIGHHSANVAMICDELMGGASANLLRAALGHDLAETWTGDIPAPVKWNNEAIDYELEVEENAWRSHFGVRWEPLSEEEQGVLKFADTIDLCFKCLEELSMGNSLIEPIFINGINYASSVPLNGRQAGAARLYLDMIKEYLSEQGEYDSSRGRALHRADTTLGFRSSKRP